MKTTTLICWIALIAATAAINFDDDAATLDVQEVLDSAVSEAELIAPSVDVQVARDDEIQTVFDISDFINYAIPKKPTDIALTAAIGLVVLSFLGADAFIIIHREYLPLKGRLVDITVASTVAGSIWMASSLVVNGHIGVPSGFDSICNLALFWGDLTFGFVMWLVLLNYRMARLYMVFVKERTAPVDALPKIAQIAGATLPAIIFAIVATAMQASQVTGGTCIAQDVWKYAGLGLAGAYMLSFLMFVFLLRNIPDSFNEYKMTTATGLASMVVFSLMGAVEFTSLDANQFGRSAFTLSMLLVVSLYFWVPLLPVIYNCVTNHDDYEAEYMSKVKQNWMQKSPSVERKKLTAADDDGNLV